MWTPLRKCGDHAQILINDPVYEPWVEFFAFIGYKFIPGMKTYKIPEHSEVYVYLSLCI